MNQNQNQPWELHHWLQNPFFKKGSIYLIQEVVDFEEWIEEDLKFVRDDIWMPGKSKYLGMHFVSIKPEPELVIFLGASFVDFPGSRKSNFFFCFLFSDSKKRYYQTFFPWMNYTARMERIFKEAK